MYQSMSKDNLRAWLQKIIASHTLVAPASDAGLVLFRQIEKVEDIRFDCTNAALSPKEFFFPLSDTLFTLNHSAGGPEIITPVMKRNQVVFGIRPCDALGLKVLDRPFLDTPADARYRERRERTTLIGVACAEAAPECFCTSMGTSPDDATNVDVLLTQNGDDYLVKDMTDKGKALLEGAILKEAGTVSHLVVTPRKVPTEDIGSAMLNSFDSPYWGRVADRCIHCNICSYVCPVCYCFDIRDYTNKGEVERIRAWESCQSAGFTKLAGGADHRPGKSARLRQRFAHKLLYMDRQFGNLVGCTGCGRCVKHCPVNIDIREIMTDIQNMVVERK